MQFEMSFRRRCAIAVQGVTLKKIVSLLGEYYPNVDILIVALLKNNATVTFNNVEELLEYDNSGNYRIKELVIRTWSHQFRIEFELGFSIFAPYGTTVVVNFRLNNQNDCVGFQAKLNAIFNEMRLPMYYTILSKFSPIFHPIILLFLVFYLIRLYQLWPNIINTQTTSSQIAFSDRC